MTGQLSLCLEETAFDRFHADNPRVYQVLVRLAREWVNWVRLSATLLV